MSFWVDASLFALVVWGGQHALFLVCALACVVAPRPRSLVDVEPVVTVEPARA